MLDINEPGINEKITQLIGHTSTLEALRPKSEDDFFKRYHKDSDSWLDELKNTFLREEDEPLPDFSNPSDSFRRYVCMPGSFFLVSPVHVVTTTSVKTLDVFEPETTCDIRRLRPNLVIEPITNATGFYEQSWLGKTLLIGDIQINCEATTPGCGAVARPQNQLEEDKKILRKIVKYANQNLGVYASVQGFGNINVGDDVYLL